MRRYINATYTRRGYKSNIGCDFETREVVVDGSPVTLQAYKTKKR